MRVFFCDGLQVMWKEPVVTLVLQGGPNYRKSQPVNLQSVRFCVTVGGGDT